MNVYDKSESCYFNDCKKNCNFGVQQEVREKDKLSLIVQVWEGNTSPRGKILFAKCAISVAIRGMQRWTI